jgi:hypothetical protein
MKIASLFNPATNVAPLHIVILYYVTVAFMLASILFVTILFAARIIKSILERRTDLLSKSCQKVLSKIVINETFSGTWKGIPAFEFYMAQLRDLVGTSSLAKRLLISQILEVKKSLSGASADTLVRTYYALALHEESLKKLRSKQWHTKALGVRELAEMNFHGDIQPIRKFLVSRNRILREEALMALVKLESEPLLFLDDFKGELSLWMRINIYRYLSKIDARRLPVFSRWFNHPNLTVRLFSLSMAKQFRQTASLPALAEMIYDSNPKVVAIAVSAIGESEGYQYRDRVAKLALHVWKFDRLSRHAIACLGKIGHPQLDAQLIGKFLRHPSHPVRFEAVRALKRLGEEGEKVIEENRGYNDLQVTLKHFSEPLLSAL